MWRDVVPDVQFCNIDYKNLQDDILNPAQWWPWQATLQSMDNSRNENDGGWLSAATDESMKRAEVCINRYEKLDWR